MKLQHEDAYRISILRFVLIAVVVFLHIDQPDPLATLDLSDGLDVLRAFTQDQLGRICVPALTLISGYLLFTANLDQTPFKLYRKKARTLLIPFAIFNIGYVAALVLLELATGYIAFSSFRDWGTMGTVNALVGYSTSPQNYALHFLRELFVLVLLAPVFGLFLRRAPLIGLALVAAIFLTNTDRHLIQRDTMALMFYVGGMAAIGRWDLRKFDRYAVHCLVALVLLCAAMLYFRYESRTLIYLTAPLLVWPIASLLQGTRFGAWAANMSRYSFFIFLCHIPLIEVLRRIYLRVDHIVPEAVFVYGVPVLVIAFLVQVYRVLEWLMPKAFSIMVGGRSSGRTAPAPVPGQAAVS